MYVWFKCSIHYSFCLVGWAGERSVGGIGNASVISCNVLQILLFWLFTMVVLLVQSPRFCLNGHGHFTAGYTTRTTKLADLDPSSDPVMPALYWL